MDESIPVSCVEVGIQLCWIFLWILSEFILSLITKWRPVRTRSENMIMLIRILILFSRSMLDFVLNLKRMLQIKRVFETQQ